MVQIKDYFGDKIIGQERAIKPILNFYISNYQRTKFIKPIFLCSTRGAGKSSIIRETCRNLLDNNNNPKPLVEVNGSSIKNLRGFIDSVIIPYNTQDNPWTLFVDELDAVSEDVLRWLLTPFQFNPNNYITEGSFDGITYQFNWRKFSFFSATNRAQKVPIALQSRLTKLDLEGYTHEELCLMLKRRLKDIEFKEDTDKEIVKVSRNNPRRLLDQIGKDIKEFCESNNKKSINLNEWNQLRRILNVRTLGLSGLEVEELDYLASVGPSSLRGIAATLGLDSSTVASDVELYLLSNKLIRIESKRMITPKGMEVLKMVKSDN